VNYADDVVSTTQGSPDVSGLANIQRGTDSWKLITMVSSVPIAMHNLVQAEVMRDQSKMNKAKALVSVGMLAVVLPALMDGLLDEAVNGEEAEDEDGENEKLGVLALRTTMGSLDTALPIFARPVTSAVMFGAASVSPVQSRLNKLAQTVKAGEHIVNGVDLSAKEWAAISDVATIFTGKPFSVLGKGILLEEKLQDQDVLDERSDIREDQLAALED
jgi:hypothetical protein